VKRPSTKGKAAAAPLAQPAGSALARARLRAARPFRLRLIDAVTLAAGGLLILKLSAMVMEASGPQAEPTGFSQSLANARAGFELPDPTTTGSVSPKEPEKEARKAEPPPRPQPPMPEQAVSPTERALLEKLSARRDVLKQRSDELDLREKLLGEAERKIEGNIGDLKEAEDKAEAGSRKAADAEKAGLKNIVTMYESMKPKDAARVFDRLGHDVLVPIVLAMNPRKMAEVLAVMQPETAEKLTVALALRARGVAGPQAQAQAATGLPPNELPAIDPGTGGR
jgi:flagellar motility protein MotE (MotC chaperone)